MLMDVLPPSPVSRVWLGQLRLGLLFTQSVAPLRISLQSGAQPHLTGARARDPGKGGRTMSQDAKTPRNSKALPRAKSAKEAKGFIVCVSREPSKKPSTNRHGKPSTNHPKNKCLSLASLAPFA